MSDLISRQAAIDAIHCDITIIGRQNAELIATTIGGFVDRIKALPSAETERKKGKWINNNPVTMKCDQCGYVIKDWRWNELNFCANCGADMRGGFTWQ